MPRSRGRPPRRRARPPRRPGPSRPGRRPRRRGRRPVPAPARPSASAAARGRASARAGSRGAPSRRAPSPRAPSPRASRSRTRRRCVPWSSRPLVRRGGPGGREELGGAAPETLLAHRPEPRGTDHRAQLLGAGEIRHRARQVAVGVAASDSSAPIAGTAWPNQTSWPARMRAPLGSSTSKQGDAAPGSHDPCQLAQHGAEVGDVAQGEPTGDAVDRRVRQRQCDRVGLHGRQVVRSGAQHAERQVDADRPRTPGLRAPGIRSPVPQATSSTRDARRQAEGAHRARRRQRMSSPNVMSRLTRS